MDQNSPSRRQAPKNQGKTPAAKTAGIPQQQPSAFCELLQQVLPEFTFDRIERNLTEQGESLRSFIIDALTGGLMERELVSNGGGRESGAQVVRGVLQASELRRLKAYAATQGTSPELFVAEAVLDYLNELGAPDPAEFTQQQQPSSPAAAPLPDPSLEWLKAAFTKETVEEVKLAAEEYGQSFLHFMVAAVTNRLWEVKELRKLGGITSGAELIYAVLSKAENDVLESFCARYGIERGTLLAGAARRYLNELGVEIKVSGSGEPAAPLPDVNTFHDFPEITRRPLSPNGYSAGLHFCDWLKRVRELNYSTAVVEMPGMYEVLRHHPELHVEARSIGEVLEGDAKLLAFTQRYSA